MTFNDATKLPVILAITNGDAFAKRLHLQFRSVALKVRCDQPRVLDLHASNGRKVETLPASILNEIMSKVLTIFQPS